MSKSKQTVVLILAIMLGTASVAVAGKMEHVAETVEVEKAKQIVFECEFSAGELFIESADLDEAMKIDITYNPKHVSYELDYSESGSTGYVTLESEQRKDSHRVNTDDNEWNITLSRDLPLELDFEIGACAAEIDLGGVPITDLKIEVGAASGEISFTEPNPERLKEFDIDAGACSLDLNQLGNAGFEHLSFSGGAGSFDIDFRGRYDGQSEAELEIGLGSADIIIPRGLDVRIEADTDQWFSSVDIHGGRLEKAGRDAYETEGYDDAENRLLLVIQVGMGSVDIRFK
jgi:hypothetical protein